MTATAPPAAATGIVARGLRKRFGPTQALDGVDLHVAAGETLVILGANGAGKSTLLRILGTTVLPDEGTATVAGHDVVADPAAARTVTGLVIGDERAWYWRLSGRDNLAFFARLHGHRKRAALQRADELLDLIGLTEAGDRRVEGYSSGMRARLALGRALLGEPPVLLLDEPSRALDPVAAARFRDHAARLARDEGRAVLFATHDLYEASEMATRVMVLHRGRVAAVVDDRRDAAGLEQVLLEVTG